MTATLACRPFGTLPDGREVEAYTLSNGRGLCVAVLSYGGIVQAIEVPDRRGDVANVTLGFAALDDYVAGSAYFGAVVGRYANRIAGGAFQLDGRPVRLSTNWRGHHLHGGTVGFDHRLWTARSIERGGEVGISLAYASADGEEGYPGTLDVEVTYTVTAAGSLRIGYRATTDRPTAVNLTNHAYVNLAGEGSGRIDAHLVEIVAGHYTPVDDDLIPTGEIAPVDGTPFDLRTPTALGARLGEPHPQLVTAGGYDHNYVLDRSGPGLALAARVTEPDSGRVLAVHTTEPGLQLYSGNQLDGSLVGPSGRAYGRHGALALETQHFPDSPNHPQFPSTVLRPGETYTSTSVYGFSTL